VITSKKAGAKALAFPSQRLPSSPAHALVSVELTAEQRWWLGQFVHKCSVFLRDPGLDRSTESYELLRRVFVSARSNVPLSVALLRRDKRQGTKTTTVKMDRAAAKWWGETAIRSAAAWENMNPIARAYVAMSGALLLVALKSKRGKRPRKPDVSVMRMVTTFAQNPRGGAAMGRAATRLQCDIETVRRALNRHARRPTSRAAQLLLSE